MNFVEMVAETKVCVYFVDPNGINDFGDKTIDFDSGDDDYEDLDPTAQ